MATRTREPRHFSPLHPLAALRVVSERPSCSCTLLAGVASGGRWRRDAGVVVGCSLYSRFLCCPLVAFGSRSSELFGWFRCVLVLASLAAALWWQEPAALEELRPSISANKAESWSSSLLPAPRVAAGSSGSFFRGFPWWKSEEASRSSSFNKRVFQCSCAALVSSPTVVSFRH